MADLKQDFVATFYPLARRAEILIGNTKVSAENILAMWALETGWGKTISGENNMAGIKPGGKFRNYNSTDDFLTDFVKVFNADVSSKEGNDFFEKLANGIYEGYNPEANRTYAESVKRVFDSLPSIPSMSDLSMTPTQVGGGAAHVSWKLKWDDITPFKAHDIPGVDMDALDNKIKTWGDNNLPSTPEWLDNTMKELSEKQNSILGSIGNIPQMIAKYATILVGVVTSIVGIWILSKNTGDVDEPTSESED